MNFRELTWVPTNRPDINNSDSTVSFHAGWLFIQLLNFKTNLYFTAISKSTSSKVEYLVTPNEIRVGTPHNEFFGIFNRIFYHAQLSIWFPQKIDLLLRHQLLSNYRWTNHHLIILSAYIVYQQIKHANVKWHIFDTQNIFLTCLFIYVHYVIIFVLEKPLV